MWSSPAFPSLQGAPQGQVAPREKEEKDVYVHVSKIKVHATVWRVKQCHPPFIFQWKPPGVAIWASRSCRSILAHLLLLHPPAWCSPHQQPCPWLCCCNPTPPARTTKPQHSSPESSGMAGQALSAWLAGGQSPQHLSVCLELSLPLTAHRAPNPGQAAGESGRAS